MPNDIFGDAISRTFLGDIASIQWFGARINKHATENWPIFNFTQHPIGSAVPQNPRLDLQDEMNTCEPHLG